MGDRQAGKDCGLNRFAPIPPPPHLHICLAFCKDLDWPVPSRLSQVRGCGRGTKNVSLFLLGTLVFVVRQVLLILQRSSPGKRVTPMSWTLF